MDDCLAVGADYNRAEGGFGIGRGGEVAWPLEIYFSSKALVYLRGVCVCLCVLPQRCIAGGWRSVRVESCWRSMCEGYRGV